MKKIYYIILVIVGYIILFPLFAFSAIEFDAEYFSLYESNIFHSNIDSLEESDILHDIKAEVNWDIKNASSLTHNLKIYTDFNLYSNNSSRNRNVYGFAYAPKYHYKPRASLRLKADISQRKKDLTDNSGEISPRILNRNQISLSLTHTHYISNIRLYQTIEYRNFNYDETFENEIRQTSYDYNDYTIELGAKYKITRQLKLRCKLATQKRNYDERESFSIDRTSSEIRNYRKSSFLGELNFIPVSKCRISLLTEFGRRKENFENFYGYDYWKSQIKLTVNFHEKHKSILAITLKQKDFNNYWTENIGTENKVSIDYLVLLVRHTYELTDIISLQLYARNYNKVANDPDMDYHNIHIGIGLKVLL